MQKGEEPLGEDLHSQEEPHARAWGSVSFTQPKLDPADEQFALVDHFRRQVIVQVEE